MAQNITLLGASYPDVPAVDLPITGGGTARFHDRDIPFDFLGVEPEFVKDLHSASYILKNTDFATWTPSTTAAAIVASQTLSPTYAGDMTNYEYYLRWMFDADIQYNAGTTMKYTTTRVSEEIWQVLSKRPSSLANISANNWNGNNCTTFFTAGLMVYNNKSGTVTYTWSASYALYLSVVAATFSNSTSNTPTITFKTPAINARCSTSYLTTARAADIDQDNTKMAIKGELYRVKTDTSPLRRMFEHTVGIYNSPLTT